MPDSAPPPRPQSAPAGLTLIPVTSTRTTGCGSSAPAVSQNAYGHARLPASAHDALPERIDKVPYGRFRNVYLYITERCQLRCKQCYLGDRLDRALKMPFDRIASTLAIWRAMGGSKLTLLGGEPTLHPDFARAVRHAHALGYEHVIVTSNGLEPAIRKFRTLTPDELTYVQISLDGGSAASHDLVRGPGTFREAVANVAELVEAGFDTRLICTVSRANVADCLDLLDLADSLGVSLLKFHVFSAIGTGSSSADWAMTPQEWITFYETLEREAPGHRTRVWYQPTYARRERIGDFAAQGYAGCIGRTLDRISIFPDGRAYVCSFLFDTDLHFATCHDNRITINPGGNEFDLFTSALTTHACGTCAAPSACRGGCPAEKIVDGAASCATDPQIVPVCRLWKSDIPTR